MLTNKAPESFASLQDGKEHLQSQVIDWLRFPLAIAVVFIHSFGSAPLDLSAIHADPLTGSSLFNWMRICFSHVLTHIAVPTFFVISGFLFFRKWQQWNRQLYLKKMKSRFRTLFIPYVCWNAIAILGIIAAKIGAYFLKGKPLSNILLYFQEKGILSLFWNVNVWAEDRTNWLGMPTPMTGPIDLPLWFLRDLIVVTALTPLIYWFIKHTRHYGVLLLSLAYITGIWPNIPGFNITAVFFFCTGAYFSIYGKNLVNECHRVRTPSYLTAGVLLLLCIWFDGRNTPVGDILYPLYIITGVCSAFNLATDLLQKGKAKVHPLLTQSTFFIYAIHTVVVLAGCNFLVRHLLPGEHPLIQSLAYLLTPLLCVAVCLGIFLFMKRFLPKLLGVLTGNRY